jgi:hypothetical protein
MDAMLLATTNFARLLLGSVFLANLAMWIFRYSPAGQIGALLAIGAILAAWVSQGQYLLAFECLNAHREAEGMEAMRMGNRARWVCVVATACAVLCLIFG